MGLKQFPVSEYKLERLRQEGEVAFSRDVQILSMIVGVLIGGGCVYFFYAKDFEEIFITFFSISDASIKDKFIQSLVLFSKGLAAFIFPCCFVIILFGWMQTNFLITSKPLHISFNRLFSGLDNPIGYFLGNLINGFIDYLKWFCCLVIGTGILWLFLKDYSTGESFAGLNWFWLFVTGILVYLIVLAIISRIAASYLFNRKHMMTRSEVEAEMRETESPHHIRQALKDTR